MSEDVEQMIENYRHLLPPEDATSAGEAYLAKQRNDLWWEIRQRIKELPRALQQKIYRSAHPERMVEQWSRQRERNRRLKVEVLTYYGGGKCVCLRCGFEDIRALSIDHINGGGCRQRNENKLRGSSSFYGWLKKNEFPLGYQTLCMNCNWIKRFEKGEHNASKHSVEPIDWGSNE